MLLFVFKIVVVGIVLFIVGNWMIVEMIVFMNEMFVCIFILLSG